MLTEEILSCCCFLQQFHTLRRVCERRISAIIGEERSVELLRIPTTGNKPKFYPLVPPLDSGKTKGLSSFASDRKEKEKEKKNFFFLSV